MHSMIESAPKPEGREARKRATALAIMRCAQDLTVSHGLDGFTMDDLAGAAGVSRRTLFNYYPGKVDAVLGVVPELDPEVLATFHAGGPTGDLLDDLTVVARAMVRTEELEREDVARARCMLASETRLLGAAHQRFSALIEDWVHEIRTREGSAFDAERAQILVRVLAVLFDHAFDSFLSDPDQPPLDEVYARVVERARTVLAPRDPSPPARD